MFAVRIKEIFYMRGQGMVLAGRVESGTVWSGTRALFVTPTTSRVAVLAGLERSRELVPSPTAGEDVGLVFRDVEPSALAGGVVRAAADKDGSPPTWKVVDLRVEEAPGRWWEFWR
jgi:translation elongation factor EF-Tu-like GTPase